MGAQFSFWWASRWKVEPSSRWASAGGQLGVSLRLKGPWGCPCWEETGMWQGTGMWQTLIGVASGPLTPAAKADALVAL